MTNLFESITDAASCFTLALREAVRPGLAFLSVVLALISLGVWVVVFWIWWHRIHDLVVWSTNVVASKLSASLHVGGGVGYLLMAVAFVLAVVVTLRVLIELFLMSRIQRYCLQRYPYLRTGVDSSLLGGLRDSIGPLCFFVVAALGCLLLPVVGGVLFFVVASYFNVRGLVGDALEGLATDEQRRAVIRASRVQMTLLGLAVAAFTLVPVLGLLAPIVLGASVCHLGMRSLARQYPTSDSPLSRAAAVRPMADQG